MNIPHQLILNRKKCISFSGEDNNVVLSFEDGSSVEIKFPTVTDIIFIGEGCYDINNYYNTTYLISTYWNFTKEKYCPILFKTGQWFFINEYLEIVYDEWYYSIGIIHHGHTCYQPPIANEVVIEDKGFLVTKNDGIQYVYESELDTRLKLLQSNAYYKTILSHFPLTIDKIALCRGHIAMLKVELWNMGLPYLRRKSYVLPI